MCITATGLMIAATAASAASQYQQGREQKAQGDYQAAQANADAEAERGAAQVYADKIRKAGEDARGRARAALAGSGASLDSVSADEIDDNIVSAYEEDALVSMFSGENRARVRRAEGQSASIAGSSAARNATLSAATTVASGWYRVNDYNMRAADLEARAGRGGPDQSAAETARLNREGLRASWNSRYPAQRY